MSNRRRHGHRIGVTAESSYSFLDAKFNDLPHIHANNTRLVGVAACRERKAGLYRIHFAFQGGETWTTYDDKGLWQRTTKALAKHLDGGFQKLGTAYVWIDPDSFLAFTSWRAKADGLWRIGWCLAGSEEGLTVPYQTRAAWEAALNRLDGKVIG